MKLPASFTRQRTLIIFLKTLFKSTSESSKRIPVKVATKVEGLDKIIGEGKKTKINQNSLTYFFSYQIVILMVLPRTKNSSLAILVGRCTDTVIVSGIAERHYGYPTGL